MLGPFLVAGSLEEALVVPHEQLRFHLLHGVERNPDDDQERRPAEIERDVHAPDERRGQQHDSGKEQGARQSDAGEHPVEIGGCRPSRADAWDEAAVLLEVVGLVDGVELHRRVEVREEDDQNDLGQRCTTRSCGPIASASLLRPTHGVICARVTGNSSTDEAKITGMTPAMLMRRGR